MAAPLPLASASNLPGSKSRELRGWGRFPRSTARVFVPGSLAALREAVVGASGAVLARGAGRSYGDAALNGGHLVLELSAVGNALRLHESEGVLECGAAVTLKTALESIVPRGWFLPVVPGTQFVTVGGAIAADIHGKNHHRDGSLSRHLEQLTLLLSSGEIITCSPTLDPEAFWATVGGMGLTAVILSARIRLRRVDSAYVSLRRIVTCDLDQTLAAMAEHDNRYQYSVAWIDCLARGKRLGRGVLLLGNHAGAASLAGAAARAPLALQHGRGLPGPPAAPGFLLSQPAMRAFNAAFHALQSRLPHEAVQHYRPYFFPLDSVRDWNRLYGRRGFAQFQCVVPSAPAPAVLHSILDKTAEAGRASFLSVLKKFGPQSGESLLSFPSAGYTLALDFALSAPRTPALLAELERIVVQSGGRLYLAKDAFLQAGNLPVMYPRLDEWRSIRNRLDRRRVFNSDLARRLNLLGN